MKISVTTLALLLLATLTPAVVHSKEIGDGALSAAALLLSKKEENASPRPDQKNRKLMYEGLYNIFLEDGPLRNLLTEQCFNAYLDIGLARYENFLLGDGPSLFLGGGIPGTIGGPFELVDPELGGVLPGEIPNYVVGGPPNLFMPAGLPELPINEPKLDMQLQTTIVEGHQGLSAAAGVCRTYGGSPRYLSGSVMGMLPSIDRRLSGSIDTCEDNVWGYDHRIICAPRKEECTDQELVNTTVLIDSFLLPFFVGGFGQQTLTLSPQLFPNMEDVLDCEQSDIVVLKSKMGKSKKKKSKKSKKRATRN